MEKSVFCWQQSQINSHCLRNYWKRLKPCFPNQFCSSMCLLIQHSNIINASAQIPVSSYFCCNCWINNWTQFNCVKGIFLNGFLMVGASFHLFYQCWKIVVLLIVCICLVDIMHPSWKKVCIYCIYFPFSFYFAFPKLLNGSASQFSQKY